MKNISNRPLFVFAIMGIALGITLSGCAKTRIGKVDLSDNKIPTFLQVGETTIRDVLENIGEPFGYRERGNRSAMIYLNYLENYVFFLVGDFRTEKAYRLDLVFQNEILEKAEIKREGWGFGANIDPQLLQLLAR